MNPRETTKLDCPKCEGVHVRTRSTKRATNENAIRRRRECKFCGHAFTTVERPIGEASA